MSDLFMYSGDTATIEFTVETSVGVAYDLTGATVTFSATGGIGSISKSSATGGVDVPTPSSGEGSVSILPLDTEGWDGGVLGWALKVSTATGEVYTVADGKLVVKQPLTED